MSELDMAMYSCNEDWVKGLISELEDYAKEARDMAKAAHAVGKFSRISEESANKLADELDKAVADAKAFKGRRCPDYRLVIPSDRKKNIEPAPSNEIPRTQEKPGTGKEPEKPEPPEKPKPPEHSIIEDLFPNTPPPPKTPDLYLSTPLAPPPPPLTATVEFSQVKERLRELRILTFFAYGSNLCAADWNAHIQRVQDLARRARAIADAAEAGAEFSSVSPKDAQQVAEDAEHFAKSLTFFGAPYCPRTTAQQPAVAEARQVALNPFNQRILDIHNEERFAVHVPALKWNYKLELEGIAYAHQLATTRQLAHSPREGRGIERENLLQTNIGWSPDRMMQSWTMEKRDFMPGYYPNVARDGNWLNVSHYTAMIWPTTTDLGCGYAEGGGFGWLVCYYSPGGNKDGKPVGITYPLPERG
jgi:uncharacterized protein YkwD